MTLPFRRTMERDPAGLFIYPKHRSTEPRQDLVLPLLTGRSVLDLGCGMGIQRPDGMFYRIAEVADHVSGICRTTTQPSDGVVDPDLRVHETENVWVCSNGVFPTNGAANPTLTLTALALRLSKHLAK